MRVLHINTYDNGGAAKAAIRLHSALLAHEVESKLLLKCQTKPLLERDVYFYSPPPQSLVQRIFSKIRSIFYELRIIKLKEKISKREARFIKVISSRPQGLEMVSLPVGIKDLTKLDLYQEADIIHFHWVADFLDWETFFRNNTKPVVWTFHDQNPMLGYEHYDERFFGIDEFGFPIRRIKSQEEIVLNEQWISFKKRILTSVRNLTIVTPSKWLYDLSIKSLIFKRFNHYHIPNPFPIHIYKPLDKSFSRTVLNLPLDKIIILFVAESVRNQRKGFAYLKEAICKYPIIPEACICTIGQFTENVGFDNLISLDYIKDEYLLAVAYSAADVFIIPSLEDNLPNTMIESLLCGTPIIAFPTGGIEEVIENGVNGFLCEDISVESLRENIQAFCNDITIFNRQKISLSAKEKFSGSSQAKIYIDLYHSINKYVE